ncbi:MAG: hypothetical protein WCE42_24565, partial [Rhizobium ruizarguesonis]
MAGQTPQQQGRVVAAYLSADLVVPMIRPVNVASLIPEALCQVSTSRAGMRQWHAGTLPIGLNSAKQKGR